MLFNPHYEMLIDDTHKAKQNKKSLGKEWSIFNIHHRNTTYCTSNEDSKNTKKRRQPQRAFWTKCQKFWFRSWNPSEQLAGFQHLGCKTEADGKLKSELKVKPEKGCIFEQGRCNYVFIWVDDRMTPQRWKVLLELVLKEHSVPKMCLVPCYFYNYT